MSKSKTNKVSLYRVQVLDTNKNLKGEVKSLSGARAILLTLAKEIKLPTPFKTFLQKSKKDKNAYGLLVEFTRKSKAGNYSPFFLLQALYKLEKQGKLTTVKANKPKKVA